MHALLALALAAPVSIPVQGVLTEAAGDRPSGPRALVLTLYGDAGRTQPLWTRTYTAELVNGTFSVALEAGTPTLDDAVFSADRSTWLGVAIVGGPESDPVALGHVPYAAIAARADYAAEAGRLGTITPEQVFLNTDTLPWSQVDVSAAPARIRDGYTAAANAGLSLTGTAFSVDTSWLTAHAPAYSAAPGGGLLLTGTAFSVDTTWLSSQVTASSGNISGNATVTGTVRVGNDAGATCPTSGGGPLGTLRWSGTNLDVCTATGWISLAVSDNGSSASTPGLSCLDILTRFPGSGSGLRWIKPSGAAAAY